jgi:hypothetical protein
MERNPPETEAPMTRRLGLRFVAFGAVAVMALGNGTGGPEENGTLKVSVPQKWDINLPMTAPVKLAAGPQGTRMIPIAHAVDGMALAVDTNGDGKMDDKVKGIGGVVAINAKTTDGKTLKTAVRVVKNGADWDLYPAAYVHGRVGGQEVKLIDMNLNGRYDDVGADAMVVGRTNAASLLSKVANLGGKLYELTASSDGSSVTAKLWEGEAGMLNLRKSWKSDGSDLESAVISSTNGEMSFELSDAKSGLKLPVGEYSLVYGFAKKGAETVKIKAGPEMKPFKVEANGDNVFAWGGPLEMDFTFTIDKETITVPTNIRYFGSAGEEYYEFKPDGKPPLIVVTDAETGQVVREGRFGGC